MGARWCGPRAYAAAAADVDARDLKVDLDAEDMDEDAIVDEIEATVLIDSPHEEV
jgi:hypothetical protein